MLNSHCWLINGLCLSKCCTLNILNQDNETNKHYWVLKPLTCTNACLQFCSCFVYTQSLTDSRVIEEMYAQHGCQLHKCTTIMFTILVLNKMLFCAYTFLFSYTNFHQNTTLSLVNFHVQVLISVSLNKISLKYHPIYHDSSPEITTIIYMSKKLNFNKINLHSFFTVLYNCRSLTVKVSNIVLLFLICMLQSLNRKKTYAREIYSESLLVSVFTGFHCQLI